MQFDFTGKTVIVTGGSRGIGAGIVKKLIETHANVIFTFNSNKEAAQKLLHEMGNPKNACFFQLDLKDTQSIPNLIKFSVDTFGSVYALINNAGIRQDKSFFSMTNDEWSSVLHTNLDGTVFLTQAFVKQILRQGGKIVNMSSVSGLVGMPGQANYSASKGALIALTRTLGKELAPFNIQVNAIAPGFIETEMVLSMPEKEREKLPKKIPMKRLGQVSEVTDAVCFLLEESSNYITGQTLVIDGGMSA